MYVRPNQRDNILSHVNYYEWKGSVSSSRIAFKFPALSSDLKSAIIYVLSLYIMATLEDLKLEETELVIGRHRQVKSLEFY